jgi:hypothetical protein
MRDVAIGYIFISSATLILWISIFVRKRKLQRRLTDLKEELGENR